MKTSSQRNPFSRMGAVLLAVAIVFVSWGPGSYSALAEDMGLGGETPAAAEAAAPGLLHGSSLPSDVGAISPEEAIPYDLTAAPIDEEARASLIAEGYRFDDDSGRVFSPKTQKPVTEAELSGRLKGLENARRSQGSVPAPPDKIQAVGVRKADQYARALLAFVRGDDGSQTEFLESARPEIGSQEKFGAALTALGGLGKIAFHEDPQVSLELAKRLPFFQALKKHLPQTHDEFTRVVGRPPSLPAASSVAQDADPLLAEAKNLWKELEEAARRDKDVRSYATPIKKFPRLINLSKLQDLIEAKEGKRALTSETLSGCVSTFLGLARCFLLDDPLEKAPSLLARASIFSAIFAASLADFSQLKPMADAARFEGPGWLYFWRLLIAEHFLSQPKFARLKSHGPAPVPAFLALREELVKRHGAAEANAFLLRAQRNIAILHLLDPLRANELILKTSEKSLALGAAQIAVWAGFETNLLKPLGKIVRKSRLSADQLERLLTLQRGLPSVEVAEIYKDSSARVEDLIERLAGLTLIQNINSKIAEGYYRPTATFKEWKAEDVRALSATASLEAELLIKADLQEDDFLGVVQGRLKKGTPGYTQLQRNLLAMAVRHNRKIGRLFREAGLNYQAWASAKNEVRFEAEDPNDLSYPDELVRDLRAQLLAILGDFKNRTPGRVPWAAVKKIFNATIKSWHIEKDLNQGLLQLYLTDKLDQFINDFNAKTLEVSGLEDALHKPALPKKVFEVKLWKRQPGCDLFQGNFTDCCIAFGRKGQGGDDDKTGVIEDYLMDTGVNIIEVVESKMGRTVAQTFAFPAVHPDGSLSLVLDNIEIHKDYRFMNREIRNNLFRYARSYADSFGNGRIKNIYLGVQEYREKTDEGEIHVPGDDIPKDGLWLEEVSMAKFGGPLRGSTYLDSFYLPKDRRHDGSMKTVPLFVVPPSEQLSDQPPAVRERLRTAAAVLTVMLSFFALLSAPLRTPVGHFMILSTGVLVWIFGVVKFLSL